MQNSYGKAINEVVADFHKGIVSTAKAIHLINRIADEWIPCVSSEEQEIIEDAATFAIDEIEEKSKRKNKKC